MGLTNNLGKLSNMITSTGSAVGIGQPSPSYTLDVSGTGRFTSTLLVSGSLTAATSISLSNDGTYGSNYKTLGLGGTTNGYNRIFAGSTTNDGLYICSATGVGIQFRVNGNAVDVLGISSTGAAAFSGSVNVNGLATSANYKLGVTGAAFISGTNNKGVFITDGASYASIVGLNSAISVYNPLELRASGTDGQLYLTTGGNISMGSLTDAGFRLYVKHPTGGIYVEAGTTSSHKALQCNTADGGSILFFVRGDGLINTGLRTLSPYNFSVTGNNCYINSSGELGYLSSTRESKANIESIKSVNFINQLNPVQFNYRKKNSETNEYTDDLYDNTNYGFIADEVEKVNKDLVFYKSDGTTLAGVEYNNMIAILTKAIQELSKQNEQLSNRLNKAGL